MIIQRFFIAAAIAATLGTLPAHAMVPFNPPGTSRPSPPPGFAYRWVPAQYRTVYERIWVEESCDLIPDWTEISPGRWVQQWRRVITPAHWSTTTRRELLRPGYWELVRIDDPRPYPEPRPFPDPRPITGSPTVGVDGYAKDTPEDLSKFSGLKEWPR